MGKGYCLAWSRPRFNPQHLIYCQKWSLNAEPVAQTLPDVTQKAKQPPNLIAIFWLLFWLNYEYFLNHIEGVSIFCVEKFLKNCLNSSSVYLIQNPKTVLSFLTHNSNKYFDGNGILNGSTNKIGYLSSLILCLPVF